MVGAATRNRQQGPIQNMFQPTVCRDRRAAGYMRNIRKEATWPTAVSKLGWSRGGIAYLVRSEQLG